MRLTPRSLAAALLGAILIGAAPLHAQQADVVRGRVIGPDSVAIEGAQVTVTSLSGNVSRTAEVLGLERSHMYRKMKALGIAVKE